jgi:hypothetical protein
VSPRDHAIEIDELRREVTALRIEVGTAVAVAAQANELADRAAREVHRASIALGLTFGIALLLIVLAVIPGGQI